MSTQTTRTLQISLLFIAMALVLSAVVSFPLLWVWNMAADGKQSPFLSYWQMFKGCSFFLLLMLSIKGVTSLLKGTSA